MGDALEGALLPGAPAPLAVAADPVVGAPVWSAAVLVAVVGLLALGAAAASVALGARSAGRSARSGLVVPLVETARLLVQQRRTTMSNDDVLTRVGGGGLLVAALLGAAVVPVAGYAVADLSVGVVWLNASEALVWALVWLLGWGANSAVALVGGYRWLAVALSYELPLMFALTSPAVAAGSLDLGVVAAAQADLWYVVWMPAAAAVYLVAVLAFAVSGPFAAPLAPDLAGGAAAEASGTDRLLVLAGRWALLVAGAAAAVPLFLGGGAGPLLPAWLWSLVKTVAVLGLLVVARARLPLLRLEGFLTVAWTVLVPLTLLQALVVSVVVVAQAG